jgi:hypothetical protein
MGPVGGVFLAPGEPTDWFMGFHASVRLLGPVELYPACSFFPMSRDRSGLSPEWQFSLNLKVTPTLLAPGGFWYVGGGVTWLHEGVGITASPNVGLATLSPTVRSGTETYYSLLLGAQVHLSGLRPFVEVQFLNLLAGETRATNLMAGIGARLW